MKYKSVAYWPKGTFDSLGNRTEDTHDFIANAKSVCIMLWEKGAGGDGKEFPLEVQVQEALEDGKTGRAWTLRKRVVK